MRRYTGALVHQALIYFCETLHLSSTFSILRRDKVPSQIKLWPNKLSESALAAGTEIKMDSG